MTRDEVIEHLNTIGQYYSQDHSDPYEECERLTEDELEALEMAIKALEQEPCDDAISREAVLKQINCWIANGEYRYTNATDYLSERIRDIPPVNPVSNISIQITEREKYGRFN